MSPFLVVFICLLAGIGMRRLRHGGGASIGAALNTVVIYVSLPAMAILQIHRMSMGYDVLLAALLPWLMFLFAWGICSMLGRYFAWRRETTGMMILLTGLGNTSFLGFPLIEAIAGKEGLPTAIVTDQLGSFFVVSTLGLIVAGIYSPNATSRSSFMARIVTFPPFIATIFAIASRLVHLPVEFLSALERIGMTLSPLALMSVGARMEFRWDLLREQRLRLATGLMLKMFLMPLLCAFIIRMVTSETDLPQKVMILEAAMPSMITGYLVGAEHKLDAKLGVLVVTFGIGLSVLSVPAWNAVLGALGY